MNQYFPAYKATNIKELGRGVTKSEYREALHLVEKLCLKKGWQQS